MDDGELVFWSINVPDVPRGKAFFAGLFGWEYSTPGPSGAVLITGRKAAFHPSGYLDPQEFSVCVHDIAATVAAARAAGGRATDPRTTPYGASSTLTDPGGVQLALSWNSSGHAPLVEGGDTGALAGWTLLSTDVPASQRFFADVFGWRTTARPADPPDAPGAGLAVLDAAPPCTLLPAGPGSPGNFVFTVDDLDRAVGLVSALGGTAEAPRDAAGGRWATAADDQHTAFTLVERAVPRRAARA